MSQPVFPCPPQKQQGTQGRREGGEEEPVDPLHFWYTNLPISFDSIRVSDSGSQSGSGSGSESEPSSPTNPFWVPPHPGQPTEVPMNDYDWWGPDDGNRDGPEAGLSSFLGDLGSGSGLDSGFHDGRPAGDGGGLRVAGIDSDSDSDSGFGSFLEDENMERGSPGEEFEWEELEGAVNEGQNLSLVGLEQLSVSSRSSLSAPEEVREESITNVEWDVLLVFNNYVNQMVEDSYVFDAYYDSFLEELEGAEMNLRGGPPAATRVVENLPLVRLRGGEDHGGGMVVVCAICKDEVVEGEMVNKLPCHHYYHGECILPWLRIRNTCPLCRYELPTDDMEYESRRRRERLISSSQISMDELDEYEYSFYMFA